MADGGKWTMPVPAGLLERAAAGVGAAADGAAVPAALRLRSYVPQSEVLLARVTSKADVPTAEGVLADLLEALDEHVQQVEAQADLLENLAPKKLNWDLKRDVAPKLERLQRMTQAALVDLLRQKVAAQSLDS